MCTQFHVCIYASSRACKCTYMCRDMYVHVYRYVPANVQLHLVAHTQPPRLFVLFCNSRLATLTNSSQEDLNSLALKIVSANAFWKAIWEIQTSCTFLFKDWNTGLWSIFIFSSCPLAHYTLHIHVPLYFPWLKLCWAPRCPSNGGRAPFM